MDQRDVANRDLLFGLLALQNGLIEQYERMQAAVARQFEANPSASGARSKRADSFRRIGTAFQASGRTAVAVGHYRRSIDELTRIEKPTPIDLYDIACSRSLISGAASEAGSGVMEAEGRAEAERAVLAVRRALVAGYSELNWICTDDPDLKPIRSRPDFQLLVMDLAFPVEPFGESG